MLEPLNIVSQKTGKSLELSRFYRLIFQDRERAAYTKIDQYNSNNVGGMHHSHLGHLGHSNVN